MKIAVIDYGVGNMHSICKALELAGASVELVVEANKIEQADGIVLPGVGAFKSAMGHLRDKVELLKESASAGKPLLGICLGMQLLLTSSEEGDSRGLDLLPGRVLRLPPGLKVPHMGWNSIKLVREHPIIAGIPTGSYMYFVHSYYAQPESSDAVLATTSYGVDFPSIIVRGSILGTQFHPEKSGGLGLALLRNFVRMVKA